jgi:hypothetical protein
MWIFTLDGFYSVVTAEEFGCELQVRARSVDDPDRLRAESFPEVGVNVPKPGRHCPWRVVTSRGDLAECLGQLARAIDYGNFKDAGDRGLGDGRAGVNLDVWRHCLQIQREAGGALAR